MTETQHDREFLRLLEEAMQWPEEERRTAYLANASADPELAREVEALLLGATEPNGFMAGPAGAPRGLHGFDSAASVDHRLGPFRLLQQLGEGGMGMVYLAEQEEPVARRVALKIAHPALVDEQALLRFEAERQALARLTHANVAQLYEAGSTESGLPFFAMEIVEGERITSFCDQAGLDLRARIELFRTVCDGAAHAHQRGVLHRDLKPSNILVSDAAGHPTAKIIDFGIAKALDRPLAGMTMTTGSKVLGTPAYMSPEAAESSDAVDTRGDVYSLGVVLYELLVGVLPHGELGDSPLRLMRRIVEEEPRRPAVRWRGLGPERQDAFAKARGMSAAELSAELEGDLDAVVMKALARDPAQRYQSIRELDDDLGRFLSDESVAARKPTLSEEIQRFVRRRRAAVTAATLIFLTLVVGVVGTSFGLLRAREEADSAKRALLEAQEVSDFLINLFDHADVTRTKGEEPTLRDVLDAGANRAESRLADQPAALARLQTAIGSSFIGLGDLDRAEPLLRSAVEIYAADRDAFLAQWAESIINLTVILGERRDVTEPRRLLGEVEAVLGDRLEEFPKLEALLNLNQGSLDERDGNYAQARDRFQVSLAHYETTGVANRRRLGQVVSHLAIAEMELGHLSESERLFRRALDIFEDFYGPDNVYVATGWHNLGTVLSRLGRLDEAEQAFRRCLEIQQRVFGADHPNLMAILHGLGTLHLKMGWPESGEQLLLRGRALLVEQGRPDHPLIAYFDLNLSWAAEQLGDLDRAVELAEDARRLRFEALGEEHPLSLGASTELARVLGLSGRAEEALELVREAMLQGERVFEPGHRKLTETKWIQGFLLTRLGRFNEAERVFLEALANQEDSEDSDPISVADIEEDLAVAKMEQGRMEEAETSVRRSLKLRRSVLRSEHPSIVESLELLVRIRRQLDQPEEAAALELEASQLRARDGASRRDAFESLESIL